MGSSVAPCASANLMAITSSSSKSQDEQYPNNFYNERNFTSMTRFAEWSKVTFFPQAGSHQCLGYQNLRQVTHFYVMFKPL